LSSIEFAAATFALCSAMVDMLSHKETRIGADNAVHSSSSVRSKTETKKWVVPWPYEVKRK